MNDDYEFLALTALRTGMWAVLIYEEAERLKAIQDGEPLSNEPYKQFPSLRLKECHCIAAFRRYSWEEPGHCVGPLFFDGVELTARHPALVGFFTGAPDENRVRTCLERTREDNKRHEIEFNAREAAREAAQARRRAAREARG